MADEEKRRLRDEVAGLAAAVSALQSQLAVQMATHHCIGCKCMQINYIPYPLPGCAPALPQVWYGTVTSHAVTSVSGFPSVAAGEGLGTYQVSIGG